MVIRRGESDHEDSRGERLGYRSETRPSKKPFRIPGWREGEGNFRGEGEGDDLSMVDESSQVLEHQ